MEYEIKNIIFAGPPSENEDGSVDQNIVIEVGVVGDTHGFVQQNKITVTIPKTKTMVTGKTFVETTAQTWVTDNYPST